MTTWPLVPLGELLVEQRQRVGSIDAHGLLLLGVSNDHGLHISRYDRISDMSRYFRVERGWFAYNPMRINVGSIGWADSERLTGVISPDYVVFSCRESIVPRLLHLWLKSPVGLSAINFATAGSVRERLYFERLARITFPLPPLSEQRRIVSRIDELEVRIGDIRRTTHETEREEDALLLSVYDQIVRDSAQLPMREVAPLVRRAVQVDPFGTYPELGIRCFGKGTFHKPSLSGSEVGNKHLYRIETGDLVFNNVFAWEGAIAVAQSVDAGRVGSHRFITCVPKERLASSEFLCFHFLTLAGLQEIGKASPGGAGRNRTLGLEALSKIEVPIPQYETQLWFDELQHKIRCARQHRKERVRGVGALLPSILDEAFRGEL